MAKLHDLYKQAHSNQNYDDFKSYLNSEPNLQIDEVDEDGNKVIDYIAMNGDLTGAEIILNKGASLKSNTSRSPLFLAIFSNKSYMVPLFLRFGADINEVDRAQFTVFYWTITQKDLEGMKTLIDNGVDLHFKRGGYRTPLHDALSPQVFSKGAQLLLENGVGLCADFSRLNDIPSGLFDKVVLIGATKDDVKLTRASEGYSQAIFTVDQFDKAIQDEESFNYIGLYRTVKRLIAAGNKDTELVRFEAYLQPLVEKARSVNTALAGPSHAAAKLGVFTTPSADQSNKWKRFSGSGAGQPPAPSGNSSSQPKH